MQVTAKQSFAHGALSLRKGDSVDVPDQTAKELATAGLVDLAGGPGAAAKQAPVASNKMALEPDNKTIKPIQEATTKK